MDANAAVYIADMAVSQETKAALRSGVAPLEAIPDSQKDWHPGSDGKVLDIVHPSLFPLMYGTSKFVAERKVPLEHCSDYIALGETVPTVDISGYRWEPDEYSYKYQWLPSDVSINAAGEANITSYINNLHPEGNRELYSAIEQVITKALPLWKMAVRSTMYRHELPRLIVEGDGYDQEASDQAEREREQRWKKRREARSRNEEPATEDSDEDDDDNEEECYKSKYIMVPEPEPYKPRRRDASEEEARTFEQTFAGGNLQVIVKLANIHLTPKDPEYAGGSWHIEVRRAALLICYLLLQANTWSRVYPMSTSVRARSTTMTAQTSLTPTLPSAKASHLIS